MLRILASPVKYIQGSGELSRIGEYISRLKGPYLFVMGGFAYSNLVITSYSIHYTKLYEDLGELLSNTWTICPEEENNPGKLGVMLYSPV